MSLSIQHLTYTHADKEVLFRDVNLSLENAEKIALIGDNGSGKSTLLRIIAGIIRADSGQIIYPPEDIFYVPQHFGQYNNQTLAQAMRIDDKLCALHAILGGNVSEEALNTLNDCWNIEEDALESLAEWGLAGFALNQPLDTLSGGEKTKVFLAGMKLHEHSILLLDEPTNHLDYQYRSLLYEHIKQSRNGMIVVSHDRTLLNQLTVTAELSASGIRLYNGNYDFYREQKDQEHKGMLQKLDEKEKQLRYARKVARETAERQQKHSVRGEKQNQKKGVSRIAMGNLKRASENTAARLKEVHEDKTGELQQELQSIRQQARTRAELQTDFNSSTLHEGKILLKAIDVAFSYHTAADDVNRSLWGESLNFEIRSGERISIVGNNGSGKTTLLKLFTGELLPTRGEMRMADNLSHVYLDQEYSMIRNELSILEQAERFNSRLLPEHELKIILNRFLFPADTWTKACVQLSGGEKMRLAFCCLMIDNNTPDLFILDEPTNNLDLSSVHIITNAIRQYHGTVIAVSHDSCFLNDIGVDRVIELSR